MHCTRCGAQLEDGVKFCTHCGARVEPLVPAAPASGDGGQVPAAGPDAGSAPEVSVEETLVTQPVPESPAPPSHQRLSRQRPQSQLPPPYPPASQGSERAYVPEYENEGPGVERKHLRRGRGNIVGITVLVVALIAVAAVAGVLFGGPMVKTASYYRGSLSMDTSIKANDKWAVGVVGFGVSGDGTTMSAELGGLHISGTIDSTFEADGDVVYRLSVVAGKNEGMDSCERADVLSGSYDPIGEAGKAAVAAKRGEASGGDFTWEYTDRGCKVTWPPRTPTSATRTPTCARWAGRRPGS